MKFVFLAGGVAGFLCAGIAGYLADRSADRILFDAALGCLVGALLFRWFWTVLVRGIRETIMIRHAVSTAATAAAAAAAHAAAPAPQKSPVKSK